MLENTPTQTQDKAKGMQAKHEDRVYRPKQTTSCVLFPKRCNIGTQFDARKYEATKLSYLNVHIVVLIHTHDNKDINTRFVTSSHVTRVTSFRCVFEMVCVTGRIMSLASPGH